MFQQLLLLSFFFPTLTLNEKIAFPPFDFTCDGDIRLGYPFWQRNSNPYMGYDGFEVSCRSGKPILRLWNHDYYIKQSNFLTKTITLIDEDVTDTTCPRARLDTPFDNSVTQFFGANNTKLVFFYNCTSPSFLTEIPCLAHGADQSYIYVEGNKPEPDLGERDCEAMVEVWVMEEVIRRLKKNDYGAALQQGFRLGWKANGYCEKCEKSGGLCYNQIGYRSRKYSSCSCKDGLHQQVCGGALGSMVAMILIIICLIHKERFPHYFCFSIKNNTNTQNVDQYLEQYVTQIPQKFKYSDIKKMTNAFKDQLGEGGYGRVFKGKLVDGRPIAVKILNKSNSSGEGFINEVASIGRTNHVNIVSLLGFCAEGSKRALIYEFMINGSLEKFIYSEERGMENPLGWEKLYQIAVGIARGLEYLHRGCSTRILHFDIKPHNILLDQDLCPKISDFGLAKLCLTKESIVSVFGTRGTIGYIAPEVYCRNFGLVSYKSDVYSYGMLLLEMVGGRKNFDEGAANASEIYFPDWIYKRLEMQIDLGVGKFEEVVEEEIGRKMILVGLWCIQTDPANRPSMSRVVEMLEGSIGGLQLPPKPFFSTPSYLK